MKQKSKNNFNKNIKRDILLISLALFRKWFWSTEFKVNLKWIRSDFYVDFQWSEFEVWFEVFKLVQDLGFSSLENNQTMLLTLLLKRATKKKIFHSSVSIFDTDKVGFLEKISKSLSRLSLCVLTKYIFLVYFPCCFS